MTDTDVLSAELELVSARIARIPDTYRRFSESEERTRRFYRIPPEDLERLLDLGLPHRADATGRLFDDNDLKSVSMALRTRSPQRAALKAMADALVAGQAPETIRRGVTLQAHCPDPGHEGLCGFTLADEVARAPQTSRVRCVDPRRFDIDVRVQGGPARHLDLTEPERRLAAEASRLRFHRIPYVLNLDLGFLADTGLADCRLATFFLAARGRELGIPIREATGLFLARPSHPGTSGSSCAGPTAGRPPTRSS